MIGSVGNWTVNTSLSCNVRPLLSPLPLPFYSVLEFVLLVLARFRRFADRDVTKLFLWGKLRV